MKILFSGASSFTGFWFIAELAKRGHEVHALCRKPKDAYEGLRKKRLEKLLPLCYLHFSSEINSPSFYQLIENESPFSLFCHHAAETKNYKSPSFDCAEAVANNAKGAGQMLESLQQKGCNHLLLTGSFFEFPPPLKAFSPYGLSKTLSYEIFLFYAEHLQVALGKFVIPNPFGPYEEERFTSYLIRSWKDKKPALIKTPGYLRDNVPIFPLAKAYADYAEKLVLSNQAQIFRPSGYVETQAEFTQRLAKEMAPRLAIDCPFLLEKNPSYPEPMELKNNDFILQNWDENFFWDEFAEFYEGLRP